MVNIKQYPFMLKLINKMLRQMNGIAHTPIKSAPLPGKFAPSLAKAEEAAKALYGRKVRDFIKDLPDTYPRTDLKISAFNFITYCDYDVLRDITDQVKGGKVLHRLLDDAYDGSLSDALNNQNMH